MTLATNIESQHSGSSRTELPVVLHARVVSGAGGGPEKTILNSPRFLTPLGYHGICAYMHPPRDAQFATLVHRAEALDAPLVEIDDRGPMDVRVVARMLRLCRRERVAIWHGHDYKSNMLGLLLRRFWRMRLVTTVHGWVKFTRRTPIYYGIDRFCLRHYERVLCVSDDLYGRCLSLGVDRQRCTLIRNAIDTQQFSRRLSIDEAKARLGLPPERKLIGAIGRLSAEKGFLDLIGAVDQLLRQNLDVELWIVGEGDQRTELEARIAELGRQDRVRLVGYQQDLLELYQAMDVFALPSIREGLPNVLLEAMALGVPIVATRVAGVPRLINSGENGMLVEPGDVDELARSLEKVLGDADLCERLAEAGRATVETDYRFEARMAHVAQVYDELLGRPAHQSAR